MSCLRLHAASDPIGRPFRHHGLRPRSTERRSLGAVFFDIGASLASSRKRTRGRLIVILLGSCFPRGVGWELFVTVVTSITKSLCRTRSLMARPPVALTLCGSYTMSRDCVALPEIVSLASAADVGRPAQVGLLTAA